MEYVTDIDSIKAFVRGILEANAALFIRFEGDDQTRLTKKDCNEIGELIKTHPETKILIDMEHVDFQLKRMNFWDGIVFD